MQNAHQCSGIPCLVEGVHILQSTIVTVLASRGFRHSAVHVWNNSPDNIHETKTCDIFKR